MKVYIAGKITGDKNYKAKFDKAMSEQLAKGYKVMSPACLPEGFTHEDYMTICYAMISVCDMIYLLSDWRDSPGAKKEHMYASCVGKRIAYE